MVESEVVQMDMSVLCDLITTTNPHPPTPGPSVSKICY